LFERPDVTDRFNCDFDVNRLRRGDQTPVRRHAGRFSFLSVPRGTNSHEGSIERLFELLTEFEHDIRTGQEAVMSVVAHRTTERTQPAVPPQRQAPAPSPRRRVQTERELVRRRRAPVAPPRRVRVAGAPRIVTRAACAPRQRLPLPWLLALAGATCAAVVGLGILSGSGEASVPTHTSVVRIEPGESLWDLAGRVAPGSDPSAVVARIRDLNGGLASGVTPGQPLTVPAG
jgi:hypothetical protein